jgi:KRAB domain-containing zinc finger protein
VEKFTCDCPDLPWVPKRAENEKVGKNFRLRERHIKTVHWGWKGCDQCVKAFEKVEALAAHEKKHTLTFMCDQCEFVANCVDNLTNHSQRSHPAKPAPAPCQDCGKCLPTEAAMKIHIKMVHTSAVCPVCGVTKNIKSLKFHMEQTHVDDSEKRFHCEDCGKGFMTKQSFDSHRMNNHIKERPYICRHGCEKRYNDRSNRIAHEKRRHGGLARTYKLPDQAVLPLTLIQ